MPEIELRQPLSQPVPERIWLLDLGSGDIVWSADPQPDPGDEHDGVEYRRIEYVRVDAAYQAGLLAGAKAMQAKAAEVPANCCADCCDAIEAIDPAQIARDTSLSPEITDA